MVILIMELSGFCIRSSSPLCHAEKFDQPQPFRVSLNTSLSTFYVRTSKAFNKYRTTISAWLFNCRLSWNYCLKESINRNSWAWKGENKDDIHLQHAVLLGISVQDNWVGVGGGEEFSTVSSCWDTSEDNFL